jgi:hypothetical protein
MSQTLNTAIAVIGIDIGKNSFHVVGHDARGAIGMLCSHNGAGDFRAQFDTQCRPPTYSAGRHCVHNEMAPGLCAHFGEKLEVNGLKASSLRRRTSLGEFNELIG